MADTKDDNFVATNLEQDSVDVWSTAMQKLAELRPVPLGLGSFRTSIGLRSQ